MQSWKFQLKFSFEIEFYEIRSFMSNYENNNTYIHSVLSNRNECQYHLTALHACVRANVYVFVHSNSTSKPCCVHSCRLMLNVENIKRKIFHITNRFSYSSFVIWLKWFEKQRRKGN